MPAGEGSPAWERSIAWAAGVDDAMSSVWQLVWMGAVARCCHPRLVIGSSSGSGGCVRSFQAGGCQPALHKVWAAWSVGKAWGWC